MFLISFLIIFVVFLGKNFKIFKVLFIGLFLIRLIIILIFCGDIIVYFNVVVVFFIFVFVVFFNSFFFFLNYN